MFNENDVQVGDLLFYEAKDLLGHLIGFFSDIFHPFKINISHVSGISKIVDGKVYIIEAHLSSGVIEKELNPKWYPVIQHKRLKCGLSQIQKSELITYIRKNILGHKYDAISFPSKFIRIFFWSKETPLLNSESEYDCAETWSVAYKNSLNIDLTPRINMRTVNPQQLSNSTRLTTV